MKNSILLFGIIALCSLASFGQVSISPKLSNNLNFATEDGLSCFITSNLDKPVNVYLEIQINSERGFGVVVAKTENFPLNIGFTTLDRNSIILQQKKYLNRDFGSYEQANGHLPAQGYSVCLALRCVDNDCNFSEQPNREVTTCFEKIAINPTPLLLASPYDEAELTDKRPNFSWIPPMPIGNDPNLNYRFTLVELREKQSPDAGIMRNRPIFQISGLPTISLPYPGELEDLRVGTTYAWQVVALLGKTPVQASEVWEFEIVEKEEEVFPMPFVRLKRTDDQIYNALNELKFIYNQTGNTNILNYKITTITGTPVVISLPSFALNYGENKYTLDLTPLGLEHKQYYILEVLSDKRVIYLLKFRYCYKKEIK